MRQRKTKLAIGSIQTNETKSTWSVLYSKTETVQRPKEKYNNKGTWSENEKLALQGFSCLSFKFWSLQQEQPNGNEMQQEVGHLDLLSNARGHPRTGITWGPRSPRTEVTWGPPGPTSGKHGLNRFSECKTKLSQICIISPGTNMKRVNTQTNSRHQYTKSWSLQYCFFVC